MISVKKVILNFMSYARGHIYTKSAKIGLKDTQVIILTIMIVDSRGEYHRKLYCLVYHHPLCVMVVMIENLATDRSQAMTCILTWHSTCRRCEKTGLL